MTRVEPKGGSNRVKADFTEKEINSVGQVMALLAPTRKRFPYFPLFKIGKPANLQPLAP